MLYSLWSDYPASENVFLIVITDANNLWVMLTAQIFYFDTK